MLVIRNYFNNLLCESFKDPQNGRIRVRPLPGQGLLTDLVIECSKQTKERFGLGAKFRTISVKVCEKPDGRFI